MDRLRSPGGCPWDGEQTHGSLAKHGIEEMYELVDAIEADDRTGLREELGDVLLQVVFHARVAEEHPTDPFDLDTVAGLVADKLIERHPHVFGDAEAPRRRDAHMAWERMKAQSRNTASVLDGIPKDLPALARAQKTLARTNRSGLDVRDPAGVGIGPSLLRIVARAEAEGRDAEGELRAAVRRYEAAVREAEGVWEAQAAPGAEAAPPAP